MATGGVSGEEGLGLICCAPETRKSALVTKRGVQVAEIQPPPEVAAGAWLGAMAGTAEIKGDIVALSEPEGAWGKRRLTTTRISSCVLRVCGTSAWQVW
jgi:hypothetical protein